MKNYIAPNVKVICLDTENDMLQLLSGSIVNDPESKANGSAAMSNGRDVSSSIWGEEE